MICTPKKGTDQITSSFFFSKQPVKAKIAVNNRIGKRLCNLGFTYVPLTF